jgi:hypothetical protein
MEACLLPPLCSRFFASEKVVMVVRVDGCGEWWVVLVGGCKAILVASMDQADQWTIIGGVLSKLW